MKVLVADDDQDVRMMLAEFLTGRGVEVIEASDGTETLRHVTRCRLQAVELDALVLDLRMPRLGGIEALKRIRTYDPALPVIIMTGNLEPALHRQAQALGARAVLRKPVILSQLWDILLGDDTAVRDYEAALAHGARPRATRASSTRVLIIDDEADLRETLVEFLESRGYETSTAADGITAVRMLVDQPVDVILLDMSMPGLSGVDALPTIRAIAPRTAVIMVTANIDAELARRALAHGAFDYLVKPINWRDLAQSLKMALERRALDAELDLAAEKSGHAG